MDDSLAQELARRLHEAERRRQPIPPITDSYPELGVADAYQVQRALIALKLRDGAQVVGWKIGLTSRPMQEMFGIDTPDFGHLLDSMALRPGERLSCSLLIAPRVEPEVAFVLGRDLQGPGVGRDEVLAATERVAVALEVIDSRIEGWRIRLADTIADNASSARFVLGEGGRPPQGLDLAGLRLELLVDGRVAAAGTGAAVLGHPAEAVAWLCNTLCQFGEGLRRGQVVLSGAVAAAVDLGPGRTFLARCPELGEVSLETA
ncbi:MAG TPA: fumarylacetoacetate hydrolase family protein [Dehalococcoidia bacterium]|nr:fumarylacetoacetate hydrolase family protein [Dehalococcoidia bacterium]